MTSKLKKLFNLTKHKKKKIKLIIKQNPISWEQLMFKTVKIKA